MPIVIKKRVSLDFLGEDYKDSYLLLKSVAVGEFDKFKKETVKDAVISHFISGEINQEGGLVKITRENIEELPGEVFVNAFGAITGQLDPKVPAQ